MRRAAEITKEHGFTHFSVLSDTDDGHASTVDFGTTYQTTLRPNYGTGTYKATTTATQSKMTAHYPKADLVIRCYDGMPEGRHIGTVFVAADILAKKK